MFQNRQQVGLLLARKLKAYDSGSDALVVAIPRGGVVVGAAIAKYFNLPLAVVVVKKLGAPGNSELAIGAIAPDGIKVIDAPLALRLGVDQQYLDEETERKSREVEERINKLGIKNLELRIKNAKFVILVDDGVATGSTVLVAIKYTKHLQSKSNSKPRIILAVPVVAKDSYDRLKSEVDKLIALEVPESFGSVGQFYREFPQVSDDEVKKILELHK